MCTGDSTANTLPDLYSWGGTEAKRSLMKKKPITYAEKGSKNKKTNKHTRQKAHLKSDEHTHTHTEGTNPGFMQRKDLLTFACTHTHTLEGGRGVYISPLPRSPPGNKPREIRSGGLVAVKEATATRGIFQRHRSTAGGRSCRQMHFVPISHI